MEKLSNIIFRLPKRPFSFQAHGNHPLCALLIDPAREA
nr:MAG TPA: hypothetical protein [Caudoviricetes sp.]